MADPAAPRLFRRLQALDDAIAYRRARLTRPCPDCRDSTRCDDHACDLALLAGYADDVRAAGEAIQAASDAIRGARRGGVPGARRAPVAQS